MILGEGAHRSETAFVRQKLQGSPRYLFFFTVPDRTVLRNDGTFQTVDGISISHGTTFGGTRYRRI